MPWSQLIANKIMTHQNSIILIHPNEIMMDKQNQGIPTITLLQPCNTNGHTSIAKPIKKKTNPIKQSNMCQQGNEVLTRTLPK